MKNKTKNHSFKLFIVLMCVVTMVALVSFTIFSFGINAKQYSTYVKTNAEVIGVGEDQVTISFAIPDKNQIFEKSITDVFSNVKEKDVVVVYYNKTNPTDVIVSLDKTPFILLAFTIGCVIISTIMIIIIYRPKKLKKVKYEDELDDINIINKNIINQEGDSGNPNLGDNLLIKSVAGKNEYYNQIQNNDEFKKSNQEKLDKKVKKLKSLKNSSNEKNKSKSQTQKLLKNKKLQNNDNLDNNSKTNEVVSDLMLGKKKEKSDKKITKSDKKIKKSDNLIKNKNNLNLKINKKEKNKEILNMDKKQNVNNGAKNAKVTATAPAKAVANNAKPAGKQVKK